MKDYPLIHKIILLLFRIFLFIGTVVYIVLSVLNGPDWTITIILAVLLIIWFVYELYLYKKYK